LLQQMLRQSAEFAQVDTSLVRVATSFMEFSAATKCLGILGVLASGALTWRYRKNSALIGLSIAAVIGRLAFYHRQYDNTMLVIPLVVCGRIALEANERRVWIGFALFALTLWAPLRYADYSRPMILGLSMCWMLGLAVICRHARHIPVAEEFRELDARPGRALE
jgi:hypothetical protein